MERRQIELIIIINVGRWECKRNISVIEYNAPTNLMLENAPNQMHTKNRHEHSKTSNRL